MFDLYFNTKEPCKNSPPPPPAKPSQVDGADTTPQQVRQSWSEEKTNLVQVYLAEFNALRSEILQLSTKQQSYLVVSFGVTSYGFLHIVQPTKGNDYGLEPPIWFVLCLVLCALGLMYCDADLAIVRCATYIERYLKPRLMDLFQDKSRRQDQPADRQYSAGKNLEFLGWEPYIRVTHSQHAPFKSVAYGLFVAFPALVCLFLFCQLSISLQKPSKQLAEYAAMVFSLVFFLYRLLVVSQKEVLLPPGRIPHEDKPPPTSSNPFEMLTKESLILCTAVSILMVSMYALSCHYFSKYFGNRNLDWADFLWFALLVLIGEICWFVSYEKAISQKEI